MGAQTLAERFPIQRRAPVRAAPVKVEEEVPEIKKEKKAAQRSAAPPAPVPKPEPIRKERIVEVEVPVEKIVEVEVPREVEKVVEREKIIERPVHPTACLTSASLHRRILSLAVSETIYRLNSCFYYTYSSPGREGGRGTCDRREGCRGCCSVRKGGAH